MAAGTKKVHDEQGIRQTSAYRNTSQDSGVDDGSNGSDRASLGTAPDPVLTGDEQRAILSAVQEALDAANEKIRQLEAANAKLNIALTKSKKNERLLKRERARWFDTMDDTLDDLEDEEILNGQEREDSSNGSGQGTSSRALTRISRRDEKRSSIIPAEKSSSAKSNSLGVISQPARFFQIGRVFKMLWTEPAGETAADTDKEYYHPVGYGQLSFTKMRRFVVVRKRLHSCLCLAISTYGGQGAAKKDSRSQDHTAVYSSKDSLPQDVGFIKEPISIIIEEPSETIDPKSMIDFGRVYTVEHNVKVLNVGRLPKWDKKCLDQYFTETIGRAADLDDQGYRGDGPFSRSASSIEQRRGSPGTLGTDKSYLSKAASKPNPMANKFTPVVRPPVSVASSKGKEANNSNPWSTIKWDEARKLYYNHRYGPSGESEYYWHTSDDNKPPLWNGYFEAQYSTSSGSGFLSPYGIPPQAPEDPGGYGPYNPNPF
ncbi:hypothetical protein F5882DRAFT_404532 [Hyaloscypha sp. PMI_1271]|nr:hypothetical protein F5882DRAFT_404532 [Hyaloscypha sp. PMI_1271]